MEATETIGSDTEVANRKLELQRALRKIDKEFAVLKIHWENKQKEHKTIRSELCKIEREEKKAADRVAAEELKKRRADNVAIFASKNPEYQDAIKALESDLATILDERKNLIAAYNDKGTICRVDYETQKRALKLRQTNVMNQIGQLKSQISPYCNHRLTHQQGGQSNMHHLNILFPCSSCEIEICTKCYYADTTNTCISCDHDGYRGRDGVLLGLDGF